MISEGNVAAAVETASTPRHIALVRITHWIVVLSVLGLLTAQNLMDILHYNPLQPNLGSPVGRVNTKPRRRVTAVTGDPSATEAPMPNNLADSINYRNTNPEKWRDGRGVPSGYCVASINGCKQNKRPRRGARPFLGDVLQ